MKRELISFNDMHYLEGSLEVWRVKAISGADYILANMRNVKEVVRANHRKVSKLKDVSIGGIDVDKAFDIFYEIERDSELPAPSELTEMNNLGKLMQLEDFTPLNLAKVLTMYYNIMEVADDFDDLMDPYDQLDWDALDSSDMDKPLDHKVKF